MARYERTTPGGYLLVLVLCTSLTVSAQQCFDNSEFAIRSTHPTGLVLDGTDPLQVRAQHFNGFATQLWSLEPGVRPGLFFIFNSYYRKVLDFIEGPDELILGNQNYGLQQQWSVTLNNTIANAANLKNIDILKASFVAGNRVIVSKPKGGPNQQFVLQRRYPLVQVLV